MSFFGGAGDASGFRFSAFFQDYQGPDQVLGTGN